MSSQLEEILSQKKHNLDENAKEWEQKRSAWVNRINNLLKTIKAWLEPLETKQYVRVDFSEIVITEQLLGTYKAPCMTINFFNGDSVELVPKGLHIISGNGRVDLKLGLREIMIIGQDGEEEWIFAERNGPGKSRQFQFNKDNFEKILQEYLEAA